MDINYKIPHQTCMGHLHLKASDLDYFLAFCCDLPGFELITPTFGKQAAYISA